MTFTYDLTTNVGRVRFEVGDRTQDNGVRPDRSNFSDDEIEAVLTDAEGNINSATAHLLDVLSREWALVADITLGPRKEQLSQVSKAYANLATTVRKREGSDVTNANVKFIRHDAYRRAAHYDHVEWNSFVPEHFWEENGGL